MSGADQWPDPGCDHALKVAITPAINVVLGKLLFMHLYMELAPTLPPLAWVATVNRGSEDVRVQHGSQVEVEDDWFAEAVWDGTFDRDGLLVARNIFGSAGARVDNGLQVFASTALVDRIITAESTDSIVVSNSFALILAATGAELDPDYDYDAEWQAILSGVDEYDDTIRIPNTVWRFRQHYYGTVTIEPDQLTITRQRYPNAFAPETFSDIESELRKVTEAVARNARDSRRIAPMTMTTTLSSGYDSTGTAALAASVGAKTAFTRTKTGSLVPEFIRSHADDGRPAAAALGLQAVEVGDIPSREWDPAVELGLLAGSATFRELVLLPVAVDLAAEPHTAILFTGYHGDKNWEPSTSQGYLGTQIIRGDVSGLTLSEARLHAGFLNVPLPFVGAESVDRFVEISKSAEMKPWSVGGDYDRPIPRRLAEEAGVPREVFGQSKRAIWSFVGRLMPLHPELIHQFMADVKPNSLAWSIPLIRIETQIRAIIRRVIRKVTKRNVGESIPSRYRAQSLTAFHWAIGQLVDRYRNAL